MMWASRSSRPQSLWCWALAFIVSLTIAGAIAQSNLAARGWELVFPILGFASLLGTIAAARARRDALTVRPDDSVLYRLLSYARRHGASTPDP